jgi:hypothetical protein
MIYRDIAKLFPRLPSLYTEASLTVKFFALDPEAIAGPWWLSYNDADL